ncbi:hypothetical protein MA16_Dca019755 [Dendrobium catenatum]|uniref:Uncharacterized protein n=1 Tax=Dendrobium catenatum TaxID=906689 RepID=A0A2I0VQW6_9ASPA|nr:hypothetical protein MA16_Dca019755 [Dendrobium catenatum]
MNLLHISYQKGPHLVLSLRSKLRRNWLDKNSKEEKEKDKITNQKMIQSSSEDDFDIIILRPPNKLPQRGGRMALRRTTPMYIDPKFDSNGEPKNQGVALSLDYKNINTPKKFDLTLDQVSDSEVDNTKDKSDEPKLTMYEKLSRRIEALSLTPLSAGRIAGLEVKVAPNLNGEVKKV